MEEGVSDMAKGAKKAEALFDLESLTGEPVNNTNEFPKEEKKVKSNTQEMPNAITHYIEYFDEEAIEAIKEMTPEEIREAIKDDFNSMFEENQISNEIKAGLDILADNMTESIKEILVDSKKREVFFEQMQSNFTHKIITDVEIAQLFERLSVELQVAPFEQARDENIFSNITPEDINRTLQSTEVDGIYIVNGVEMTIDEEFTKVAIEAQERGEDPEKAIREYLESKETEEKEDSKDSEDIEKQSEESIIIEEVQEQIEVQQEVMQDEVYAMPEEVMEEVPVEENQQNENVVVIKKSKDGNIRVFRPTQFLSTTKVTFREIQEQQDLVRQAVMEEASKENDDNSLDSHDDDYNK